MLPDVPQMRPTLTDVRDALAWSVVENARLIPLADRGLEVESGTPIPASVRATLAAHAPLVARMLAAMGTAPLVAQLALYWYLERHLAEPDERDALEECATERAAIRECDGGMESDTAELAMISDMARMRFAAAGFADRVDGKNTVPARLPGARAAA